MTKDIRVAVVGAGRMGADHIERITHTTNGAVVSAVVDVALDRAAEMAKEAGGAAVYGSIEEAIAADAMDAVLIATPGQFHAPVLIPALEAGLPILCEKPLTQDPVSSRDIVEAEMKLDKPHIQVGFMRRFDAEYLQLKSLVESNDAGEVLMLRGVHRNPDVNDYYTTDMLITDSVVHEFSVLPWIADSRVVSVEVKHPRRNSLAPRDLQEPILVLMTLENGVLIDVEMNVSVQFGYQVATEAVFQKGIARIGQPSGMQRWQDAQFFIGEHTGFETRFGAAYDAEVQSWVDAIRRGDLVDGPNAWDGYEVALCCEAGVSALRQDGPVAIRDEVRPDFYA
jgi:myo-inositol 2-dehydrogenase/D-chiro-inositol 1-dehydrogenase